MDEWLTSEDILNEDISFLLDLMEWKTGVTINPQCSALCIHVRSGMTNLNDG